MIFPRSELICFDGKDIIAKDTLCIEVPDMNEYVEVVVYKNDICLYYIPNMIPAGYKLLKYVVLDNKQMLVFAYHYPKLSEWHISFLKDARESLKLKKKQLGLDENGQKGICELYI